MSELIKKYYRTRFSRKELAAKDILWKILCKDYFQQYIPFKSTVMDIGAGYCEFINNIKASQKIAVDVNPDTARYANKDIFVIRSRFDKIPQKYNAKIDIIFLSNFLEHLSSKEEIISILSIARKLLRTNGKLIILQPNIDLTGSKYWNFIDHKLALNIPSLKEALEVTGFVAKKIVKRFLPYTTKSILPMNALLIKIWFIIPDFFRPLAGQSFIYAEKN